MENPQNFVARLRPIICQNVWNWMKNPWQIPKEDLVNSFFQKTPRSKIGFKIKKMGGWILNPFFGKNEMTKSQGDSSFNFKHFNILWTSNKHSYQKLYPFEVKKNSIKKHFAITNDGIHHVDSVSSSPLASPKAISTG